MMFKSARRAKKIFPPPIPAPIRFEHESERAFKKRQDRFIQQRLREKLARGEL